MTPISAIASKEETIRRAPVMPPLGTGSGSFPEIRRATNGVEGDAVEVAVNVSEHVALEPAASEPMVQVSSVGELAVTKQPELVNARSDAGNGELLGDRATTPVANPGPLLRATRLKVTGRVWVT